MVQDILGIGCTGFFGVQTTCVEDRYTQLAIMLFNPYTLLPALLLMLLLGAKGWFDYFYYEDRK